MDEFKLDSLEKEDKNITFKTDNFQSGFDKVFSSYNDGVNKPGANNTGKVENRTNKAEPNNLPVQPEQKVEEKPKISEADLLASQKKGYEEGYSKGYADAKSASENLDKQINEAVKNIDQKLAQILQERKFEDLKKSEDVVELALKVARKASGKSLSENSCQVIENVIIKSFELLFDEPKILICVNSKILDEMKKRVDMLVKSEGFNSEVEIIASDSINVGACKIQWQGGGLISDHEAIWNDIESMI